MTRILPRINKIWGEKYYEAREKFFMSRDYSENGAVDGRKNFKLPKKGRQKFMGR